MLESARNVAASLNGAGGEVVLLGVEKEGPEVTEAAAAFLGLPLGDDESWQVRFSVLGKAVSTIVPSHYGPLRAAAAIADIVGDEMSRIAAGSPAPACAPGHPHPMEVGHDEVSVWWACPREKSVPRRVIATFEDD